MLPSILLVDDDPAILSAFSRAFRGRFRITTAASGAAGLALVQGSEPYAVVVSDMQMPNMNGIEFLKAVALARPDTARIMLTGQADLQTALKAVNQGQVLRFLIKPCDEEALAEAIELGVAQHQVVTTQKALLEQALSGTLSALLDLFSVFDPAGFSQAQFIRKVALELAHLLKLEAGWELAAAAQLGQIGSLALPQEIQTLQRTGGSLTPQEEAFTRIVPTLSARLVANIPRLQTVARFILYRQNDFHGEGAPLDGLAGPLIPLESRILRVATDFVTLLARKTPKPLTLYLMELQAWKYDPEVLAALGALLQQAPPQAEGSPRTVTAVAELGPSLTLTADVRATDGRLLLAGGTQLTPILIEMLACMSERKVVEEAFQVTRGAE